MKLGLIEGSFRLWKAPKRNGIYWLLSIFRVGIIGNLGAIAVVAVPLWGLPEGMGIRPVVLFLILLLVELMTGLSGIVRAARSLRAPPPKASILLIVLGVVVCLTPFMTGIMTMRFIADLHHLIIED